MYDISITKKRSCYKEIRPRYIKPGVSRIIRSVSYLATSRTSTAMVLTMNDLYVFEYYEEIFKLTV